MTNIPTIFRGFSYLEILISFLILTSGVLACAMLIARIQLLQIQSNQAFKATFMADYMVNRLAISHCHFSGDQPKERPNFVCLSKADLSGELFAVQQAVFDISSPLLEGYGTTDVNTIDSDNPLGCIDYDSTSNAYLIGVFIQGIRRQDLAETGCAELLNGLHAAVRYIPLSSLNRSTPET
jgi:hypothetical protein